MRKDITYMSVTSSDMIPWTLAFGMMSVCFPPGARKQSFLWDPLISSESVRTHYNMANETWNNFECIYTNQSGKMLQNPQYETFTAILNYFLLFMCLHQGRIEKPSTPDISGLMVRIWATLGLDSYALFVTLVSRSLGLTNWFNTSLASTYTAMCVTLIFSKKWMWKIKPILKARSCFTLPTNKNLRTTQSTILLITTLNLFCWIKLKKRCG